MSFVWHSINMVSIYNGIVCVKTILNHSRLFRHLLTAGEMSWKRTDNAPSWEQQKVGRNLVKKTKLFFHKTKVFGESQSFHRFKIVNRRNRTKQTTVQVDRQYMTEVRRTTETNSSKNVRLVISFVCVCPCAVLSV